MKQILYFFFLLIIYSCSTTIPIKKTIRDASFPTLNEIHVQEIGESLIGQFYVEQTEFIKLNEVPVPKSIKIKFEETLFELKSIERISKNVNAKIYHNGSYGVMLLPNNNLVALQYTIGDRFAKHSLKEQVPFEILMKDIPSEKNFIQEFLYHGKSGNTLKFSYREFKNDLIRPAFSQDLQYDVSEDSIIGFRNLRIQVIEASNTQIKYKVLTSF